MTERPYGKGDRSFQTSFELRDGTLVIPHELTQLPSGVIIEKCLSKIRFHPQSSWLLTCFADPVSHILSPTFQIQADSGQKLSAVVFYSGTQLYDCDKDLQKRNGQYITQLGKAGIIVVIERQGLEYEEEWRKKRLQAVGLVKTKIRKVKIDNNPYLLWTGRLKKEQRSVHRKEVDLTSKEPSWRYQKIKTLYEKMLEMYRQQGFEVIDNSPILNQIQHATFVPQAISNLEHCFGVTIKAVCGCCFQIDLRGVQTQRLHCDKSSCTLQLPIKFPPQKLPFRETVFQQEYRAGTTILKTECSNCSAPTNLIQEVRVVMIKGKSVYLMVDTSCPHCGLESSKRITVPKYCFKKD